MLIQVLFLHNQVVTFRRLFSLRCFHPGWVFVPVVVWLPEGDPGRRRCHDTVRRHVADHLQRQPPQRQVQLLTLTLPDVVLQTLVHDVSASSIYNPVLKLVCQELIICSLPPFSPRVSIPFLKMLNQMLANGCFEIFATQEKWVLWWLCFKKDNTVHDACESWSSSLFVFTKSSVLCGAFKSLQRVQEDQMYL